MDPIELKQSGSPAPSQEPAAAAPSQSRRRILGGGLGAAPILLALQSQSALATMCTTPSRMMSGNLSDHGDKKTCMGGLSPGYWCQPQKFGDWKVAAPKLQTFKASTWQNDSGGCPSLTSFFYTLSAQSPTPPNNAERVKSISGVLQFGATFISVFGNTKNLKNVVPNPLTASTGTPQVNYLRALSLWEVIAYPMECDNGTGLGQLARHCAAAYLNALLAAATGKFYPIRADQAIDMFNDGATDNYCPLTTCSDPWSKQEIIDYITSTYV